MNRRHLLVALLILALLLVALVVRRRIRGGGRVVAADAASEAGATALLPDPTARQKRDELRKRILEAWASGEKGPEVAEEAKRGVFEEHPNPDGEGIEPSVIQATMREQMFPMLRACYEDLVSRTPDAGGTVELWFKIVADEKLGGIVEEDEDHDGGIAGGSITDDMMRTCVTESLKTVTFPPPGHGGVVTVGYPIVFSRDEDGADASSSE